MMAPRDDRWIQLYSGAAYWPLNPEGCTISIEDIAHGLACNNRFNGHTKLPYSVAQHSVLVSDLCKEELQRALMHGAVSVNVRNLPFYGLMHDASEAVLHDIVRPIKRDFYVGEEQYMLLESRIMYHIMAQFGVEWPCVDWSVCRAISIADNILLVTEQRDLMNPSHLPWHWDKLADPLPERITPWTWQEAKTRFLDRFHELTSSSAKSVPSVVDQDLIP